MLLLHLPFRVSAPTDRGIARQPIPDYSANTVMTQTKQQTSWTSPKFTIDCMLANVSRQLEADGRVLEVSETGCTPTTPDQLAVGNFVKVQLWLDGEDSYVDIQLAEVRQVRDHWIGLEVIQVSPNDRMKLKRSVDTPAAMRTEEPAFLHHLLVRA